MELTLFSVLIFAINGLVVRHCRSKQYEIGRAFIVGATWGVISLAVIVAYSFARLLFISDAIVGFSAQDISEIGYVLLALMLILASGFTCAAGVVSHGSK